MSLGIFSAVWMPEIVDFISEIFLLANKFNLSSPNCHPLDTIEVRQADADSCASCLSRRLDRYNIQSCTT